MTIPPMSPEEIAKLKEQIIARKEQKNWLQGDESPKCMMTANEILSLIAAVEDKVNQLGGAPEDLRNVLCGVVESFGIDGAQKITEYALKHRGVNAFNGKPAQGKIKVHDHLIVAIEQEIEGIKPVPVMGDDDSIHLTDHQLGARTGLKWALQLLKANNYTPKEPEPNAWAYEWRTSTDSNWMEDISLVIHKESDYVRNIRPLYIRELEK